MDKKQKTLVITSCWLENEKCFTDAQPLPAYGIESNRRGWMEQGREHHNIMGLYMEGSSEEKMSQEDGEQKAEKE